MRPDALSCRCIALFLAAISIFGCVAKPPPLDLHEQLRHQLVALVPARFETEMVSAPYAAGRTVGALKGAGTGFEACLGGLGHGSCSGQGCGAALLILLAVAVTCSAVGAVSGAITATPGETSREIAVTADSALSHLSAHLDLTRSVLAKLGSQKDLKVALAEESAPSVDDETRWKALQDRGFSTVLEIGVTRIAFVGGSGADPELSLEMLASVRVVDLSSGDEHYRQEFRHLGPTRRYAQWVAGDGVAMRSAVDEGLAIFAGQIADRLFEQVDLGLSSGTWAFPGTERFGCCWLCPLSPPNDYSFWERQLRYPLVTSLQPTLSWESFPVPGQQEEMQNKWGEKAEYVTYDLRIWEVRSGDRGDLAYERRGLPAPTHRLESPLRRNWRYFWSFRACFVAGQGAVCTPWAYSLVPAAASCELPTTPATNYYRFQTL